MNTQQQQAEQVKQYLDSLIADQIQQELQSELATLESDTLSINEILANITLGDHVKVLAAQVLSEIAQENQLKIYKLREQFAQKQVAVPCSL